MRLSGKSTTLKSVAFKVVAKGVFGAYGVALAQRVEEIDAAIESVAVAIVRSQPYLGGRVTVEWEVNRQREREVKGRTAIDHEIPRLAHGAFDRTPNLFVWHRGGVVKRKQMGSVGKTERAAVQLDAYWTRKRVDPRFAHRRVRNIGDFATFYDLAVESVQLAGKLIIERRKIFRTVQRLRHALLKARERHSRTVRPLATAAESAGRYAKNEIPAEWWRDKRATSHA